MNQKNLTAQEYLASWGLTVDANEAVQAHAAMCERYAGHTEDYIVLALNLASNSAVTEAIASKPANLMTMEHLAQVIPSIRSKSLEITAISRGLLYLPSIDVEMVQDGLRVAQEHRARLDEMAATFVQTATGQGIVVFADLMSMLNFQQAGRKARSADTFRLAIGDSPLVLALSSAAEIARTAKQEGAAPMHVKSATSQDNFWTATMAQSEAERTLARLMDESISRRATDIEIAPKRDGTSQVRIRIYGDMTTPTRNATLTPEQTKEITNFLLSKTRASDGSRLRKAADGQMTYKNSSAEVFVRASFIPADRHGQDMDMVSVSLRLLARTAKNVSLSSLNLPDDAVQHIRQALLPTQGLIVLAGPTNSGKSTTIAGVVGEHVAMYGATKKRLSLEEPVERYLEGITQITVEGNFAELIRALLRHDPDLVWVGEIRDAFSAAACVRASTSGHIVMSTVHANNSIMAFRAIANYLRRDTGEATGGGASLFDLAESVSLLIGQRLIKRICPVCRLEHTATDEQMAQVDAYLKAEGQPALIPEAQRVLRGKIFRHNEEGCPACNKTGYAGELPIVELLPATRAVKDLFAQSETSLDMSAIAEHRLSTLAQAALARIEAGDSELDAVFV